MYSKHDRVKSLLAGTKSFVADDKSLVDGMNEGRFPGFAMIPEATYHALPGISSSGLSRLEESPAHYKYEKENPTTPTPAMVFGSMVHRSILEPDVFDATYVKEPKIDKRSSAGKDAYSKWLADNVGRVPVDPETMAKAVGMRDAIWNHPDASALLRPGQSELSMIWRDPMSQAVCRGRLDCLSYIDGIGWVIVDIKTTQSARKDDFARTCADFGYHRQAAYYMGGASMILKEKVKAFVFIAIEKSPPYSVVCHSASQDMLDAGSNEVEVLLDTYQKCVGEDLWPDYAGGIQEIDLPDWYMRKKGYK